MRSSSSSRSVCVASVCIFSVCVCVCMCVFVSLYAFVSQLEKKLALGLRTVKAKPGAATKVVR